MGGALGHLLGRVSIALPLPGEREPNQPGPKTWTEGAWLRPDFTPHQPLAANSHQQANICCGVAISQRAYPIRPGQTETENRAAGGGGVFRFCADAAFHFHFSPSEASHTPSTSCSSWSGSGLRAQVYSLRDPPDPNNKLSSKSCASVLPRP